MPDPSVPITAATVAGAVSGFTLALLGVDYYSLVWSLVGAMYALGQRDALPWKRAVAYVSLSTLIGAALGNGASSASHVESRAFLIVASLVAGAGSQLLVGALIQAALQRINKIGGETNRHDGDEP